MKRILCISLLLLALVFSLAACGDNEPTIAINEEGYWVVNGVSTDVLANGEKGNKGDTGEQGIQGEKGDKGDDGLTPTIEISEDGYWIINGEKTDVKAKGEDGKDATPSDENPQGLDFYLKDDGTYAVEIGKAKYLSKIEIPGTYKGKCVTEVANFGGNEYNANKYLKEIVISENITNISDFAFAFCPNLESITLPDSLISIGKYAFLECYTIKEISIPKSLQNVGEDAFSVCEGLEAVYITDLASWITIDFGDPNDDYSFGSGILSDAKLYLNNELVTNIKVPDGIEKIGANVFHGYDYINEIIIPDSVTVIGNGAFGSCENLESVTLGTGVKEIGSYAFYHCKKMTSFTMGENVEKIGCCSFNYCPIYTLVIPESLSEIGAENYISVTNLYVSSNEKLEFLAEKWQNLNYKNVYFENAPYVTRINYILNENSHIQNPNPEYYLYGKTLILREPTRYGYTFLGWYDGNNYLTEITKEYINSKLSATINLEAIWECSFLYTELSTVPNSNDKFSGINSYGIITGLSDFGVLTCINEIEIPSRIDDIKIVAISNNAFSNCENLQSIIIPSSITEIKDNAFKNCTNIKNIFFEGTSNDWSSIIIGENNHILTNSTVYFYSYTQSEEGNYWCRSIDLASLKAYDRVSELINIYNYYSIHNSVDESYLKDLIKNHIVSENYKNAVANNEVQLELNNEHYINILIEDYLHVLYYFNKEIEYDFATSKFHFDTSTTPYYNWSYLFENDIFCFLFYEGFISAEYVDEDTIQRFEYKIPENILYDKLSALSYVYHSIQFDFIISYWATGGWVYEEYVQHALEIIRVNYSQSLYMSNTVIVW